MENEKFKHKLQEPLDWQLHQQLLTLPKQKPVDDRLALQGMVMPCFVSICGMGNGNKTVTSEHMIFPLFFMYFFLKKKNKQREDVSTFI